MYHSHTSARTSFMKVQISLFKQSSLQANLTIQILNLLMSQI